MVHPVQLRRDALGSEREGRTRSAPELPTRRNGPPAGTTTIAAIAALRWLGITVLVIVVAAACGSDSRPADYLQTLPEYALAYPGATVLGSSVTPEEQSVDGINSANVSRSYRAPASRSDVLTWYARQLSDASWTAGADLIAGNGDPIKQWSKGFVGLQLAFTPVATANARSGTLIDYGVTLWANRSRIEQGPLDALRSLSEAGLAYPGSKPDLPYDSPRTITATEVRPANTHRDYQVTATPGDVSSFYDHALVALGWQPVVPAPSDPWVDVNAPLLAWRTGQAIARLSIYVIPIASSTSRPPSVPSLVYTFTIAEIPGPDVTPGLPWGS